MPQTPTTTAGAPQKIAILGLGAMGFRMAERVLASGFDLTVYNRTAERSRPLVDQGATAAATPRQAADGAEVVLSMVTDDTASRGVWLGENGALTALAPGTIAIESSTLRPSWVAELAAECERAGASFLDAPVVGSRPQAEAGQLVFLAGGEGAVLDAVRDLLGLLGGTLHHVGPVGHGTAMKLAINAYFAIQTAAMGELLGLARAAGIDERLAADILGALPITSPALRGMAGAMIARSFAPLFPIDLVEKDLAYAMSTAENLGTALPTTTAVRQVFAEAKARGFGADNISGVSQLFAEPTEATVGV